MGCRRVSSVIVSICSFITVGIAVAIVAITALKLDHVSFTSDITIDSPGIQVDQQCLLGTEASGYSLCIYAYTVAGVAIIAAIAVSLLRCLTCNLCGCGQVIDLIFSALGTAWWITAALVFTKYGRAANSGLIPAVSWRNSVWVLSWVAVLAFGLIFVITLLELLSSCCCGCCGDDEEMGHKNRR